MIIEQVRLQNFRSVRNETLQCDGLTALVGANGTGKSTFLRAINLFFSADCRVTSDDWHGLLIAEPIEIAVTFSELSEPARLQFARYLQDGKLTVSRVIKLSDGKVEAKFHGEKLQHQAFQTIRIITAARELVAAYNSLRQQAAYQGLQPARAREDALEQLDLWEQQHPELCQRERDQGQFFGFAEVAQGYLGQYIKCVFIPAIRDAMADASEGKGSPITQLLDIAVRNQLANNAQFQGIKNQLRNLYQQALAPQQASLAAVERQLTDALRDYAPQAGVGLRWIEQQNFDVPLPKAEVRLDEDGFQATVDRTGHGLQRAFVLSILQHIASPRPPPRVEGDAEERREPQPNLVLLIEEPELYQHPSRQRYLASVLARLTIVPEDARNRRMQVIYCTHSPLLVGVDQFDKIRVARKVADRDRPKETKLSTSTLGQIARRIGEIQDEAPEQCDATTLRPRLTSIMTPMVNEGFFADAAVLVEGEGDRASILGYAAARDVDLERIGVAVIPCGGKPNLDRPYAIFTSLGIPCFVVWDNDHARNDPEEARKNRSLLRLLGEPVTDWPTFVDERGACFEDKLETLLFRELGEADCNNLLHQIMEQYQFTRAKDAKKCPTVLADIVRRRYEAGARSATMQSIVDRVVVLVPRRPA